MNQIVPETSERIYGFVGFGFTVLLVLLVFFIVRQVVLTRRAAERAADAVERQERSRT